MSTETKTKEKIDLDPKYIIKLTVTLFATCLVVAFCLGLVNGVTLPNITASNLAKTNAALAKVYPEIDEANFVATEIEVSDDVAAAASAYSATVTNVYAITDGGAEAGYAVKLDVSGSQSTISMMVGLDTEGAVTGVSVVKSGETSGIGTKVTVDNAPLPSGVPVLDQFIGKTAADQPLKVGGNVDAISGATVSAKGVTNGVNGAIAAFAAIG